MSPRSSIYKYRPDFPSASTLPRYIPEVLKGIAKFPALVDRNQPPVPPSLGGLIEGCPAPLQPAAFPLIPSRLKCVGDNSADEIFAITVHETAQVQCLMLAYVPAPRMGECPIGQAFCSLFLRWKCPAAKFARVIQRTRADRFRVYLSSCGGRR
jgi:hypothetical protein